MSPETYVLLRHAHRTFATLSILGFVARWLGVMAMQHWTQGRIAKSLPHVVDTLLLLSALAMAWGAGFTPENAPWMTAKIVLLLVYIGLGVVALRPTQPPRRRMVAGIAGILVFAHIVAIAFTKQPLGLFARWS
ncbi:MAG: SirB2 family protein [Burkholderiales bacterium]|nr:SirB2 family protein [Burkholderiales bacterium]